MNTADRARRVICADGTVEALLGPVSMTAVQALINAKAGCDVVQLRHLGPPAVVMLVDDLGHPKKLPVNVEATRLYHANCIPGTTHTIRGDVVILLDEDFGGPM